jgi:hypothetical protein
MLPSAWFQARSDTGRKRTVCHECRINQISQWQTVNREQTRTNQRRYNRTFRGRAIILFNAAKARAKQRSEDFRLELHHVIEMLSVGVCQRTGVEFEYENTVGGTQSPYAPSLDRIDRNGIYEPGNVQIVCFWYNAAKQQWPEHITIELCKSVARKHSDSD